MFGTDTFRIADPRRFALAILVERLGGGMSSRLFQRVREELGLAYAVYAYKQFYQGTGQLGVYVGTQPGTAERPSRRSCRSSAGWRDRGWMGGTRWREAAAQGAADAGAREPRRADEPAGDFTLHREPYRPLDTMPARKSTR